MSLSVRSLACRRGGRTVFDGLSFEVAPGEAAVLRGPNGSGKSSLLRVLAGLIPPAGGGAVLDGVGLAEEPGLWREKVAFAGHLDAIKPVLTVRENLAVWAAIHGRDSGAVDDALDRLGLGAVAEDPAQLCSAGQRRRLGLARLPLIARPVWLLDEPTVSLDAESAAAFAAMVAEHCAVGGIALAATHVDLGLPPGPEIRLARAASEIDPFLGDDWAHGGVA